MPRRKKSYTLIEIIVVLAIIGILATLITLAVVGQRKKAFNAKVEADLGMIKNALEVYYRDKGELPANPTPGVFCAIGSPGCLTDLVPNYLAKLPAGPSGGCPVSDCVEKFECPVGCYFYYQYGKYVVVSGSKQPRTYGPFSYGWNCSSIVAGGDGLGGWWQGLAGKAGDIKMYCNGFMK